MWHVWGRTEILGNLKKRDHLEDTGIEGRVILNCILKK